MMRVRSMFAGLGGLDLPAERLFGRAVDGWEIEPIIRQSREANGLVTVGADVAKIEPQPGEYDVDMAGPPCPPFSIAGKGAGRLDLDLVRSVVRSYAGTPAEAAAARAALFERVIDPRTALVLEPLRIALAGRSPYLLWEQVPPVLPVWDACAPVLIAAGYSVALGVVNAEQHGAPQARKRAVLLARRDGKRARLPRPRFVAYGQPYGRTTPPRWRSMADGLGWGMTDRPSYSVTAGGTGSGGGLEVFGNGARRGLRAEYDAGRWLDDGVQRWSATGKSIRLSTLDVLRLQTFPDDFTVCGLIGQRTMQVGNAVPCSLGFDLLDALTA